MIVSCYLCTHISILMKKSSPAGNSCTCMFMRRRNASLVSINESFWQATLSAPLAPARESHLPGYRQRAQPPVHLFLTRVTTTILTKVAFESEMRAPESLKTSGEVF